MKTVTIYTDGACSGNPGPGRLGRVPKKVNFFGVPDRLKSSGEVNSPCGKVFARGKNAWTRHTARGARCAPSKSRPRRSI